MTQNFLLGEKLGDVNLQLEGSDNTIEVLASSKSGVILKKHEYEEEEESGVIEQEDETSWSIFQFLKNVIKMPTLLRTNHV